MAGCSNFPAAATWWIGSWTGMTRSQAADGSSPGIAIQAKIKDAEYWYPELLKSGPSLQVMVPAGAWPDKIAGLAGHRSSMPAGRRACPSVFSAARDLDLAEVQAVIPPRGFGGG
jgi:hypothetical protein